MNIWDNVSLELVMPDGNFATFNIRISNLDELKKRILKFRVDDRCVAGVRFCENYNYLISNMKWPESWKKIDGVKIFVDRGCWCVYKQQSISERKCPRNCMACEHQDASQIYSIVAEAAGKRPAAHRLRANLMHSHARRPAYQNQK